MDMILKHMDGHLSTLQSSNVIMSKPSSDIDQNGEDLPPNYDITSSSSNEEKGRDDEEEGNGGQIFITDQFINIHLIATQTQVINNSTSKLIKLIKINFRDILDLILRFYARKSSCVRFEGCYQN